MGPDAKADDVSETTESECGTIGTQGGGSSSYGGSTQDLVALLGLPSAEFLFEDRFRVDRRKLEHMILGDADAQEPADIFFQKIMNETTTHITWPCRLKIGAKSKKDPHIRIAGRQEDVQAAKAMVKSVLDIKCSRVTMKMDVSYTVHSHIIGRGGLTIKRVMEETGCHIHFPDSNRNNDAEKSNQVSIAGELKGVEQARARLRNLTPLIFSFELPIMGTLQSLPDPNSPVLKSIQEKYNIQIMFRTRPKLYGTQVMVKGCEWNVDQVKEATLKLIAHLCDSLANQVLVQMTLEISPHHHSVVLGKDCCNLKSIMQKTGAQIMFSDACDPNIPSLKKNNVSITGGIHSVYLARQQLLGSLPLVLMFDLPEDTEVDTEKISHIMNMLDVYINVRHKPKQDLRSVIIKGIERNAANIYEARKQLLGLDEPVPPVDIPSTYHIPNASKVYSNDAFEKPKCSSPLTVNTGSIGMPPIMQPLQGPVTPPFILPSKGHHLLNSPWSNGQGGPFHIASPPISAVPLPVMQNQLSNAHQVWLQQMGPPFQRMNSNSLYGSSHLQLPSFHHSNFNSTDHRDNSMYSSLSSITSTLSSPSLSPRLDTPPGSHNGMAEDSSNIKAGNFMPDIRECQDRRAPGFEKKHLERAAQQGHMAFDFEKKRLLAFQAMQNKPVGGDLRVPSGSWMGYGLSQSSPTPELEKNLKECFAASLKDDTLGDTWSCSPQSALPSSSSEFEAGPSGTSLSASNYLDSTPSSVKKKAMGMQYSDLVVLLASLGLEKYINNFKSHEIDLATFSSLTDEDLREIGVKALGARRKLLFIISEMKRQRTYLHGNIPLGEPSSSTLVTSSHFSSDWKQGND